MSAGRLRFGVGSLQEAFGKSEIGKSEIWKAFLVCKSRKIAAWDLMNLEKDATRVIRSQ